MLNGVYNVYKNGLLVASSPNIITTRGKGLILHYLAGNVPAFAGAMAVGSANVPAAVVGDTKLAFEFGLAPVTLAAADTVASTIIYKASFPVELAGAVYEAGLYPYLKGNPTDNAGNVFIGFSEALEQLSGGTSTTNSRVGGTAYTATAAAGGTTTITAAQTRGNFAGYQATDSFSLAWTAVDQNTASIVVRLLVDAANYYQYTITPTAGVGYKVVDWNKSAFVATGAPTWDNITSAQFIVTAVAGGATSVHLDAMRVNDTDTYSDYALVSRTVFGTPIVKTAGEQMDIEYVLGVPL